MSEETNERNSVEGSQRVIRCKNETTFGRDIFFPKKNTVILYAFFTKDMSSEPLKIDIEKVVKEKAPKLKKDR